VLALHQRIRQDVVQACEQAAVTSLAGVAADDEGDTIYAIDRVAEHVLVAELARTVATPAAPIVLVAEGLPGGRTLVPEGAPGTPHWTIIVDPIDGTRGLMYQKRPAWILTGVAAGPGPVTLADIELAVQTEIPLVKQHLSDQLWAVRGEGVHAQRIDRLTGSSVPLKLRPSPATTFAHGFASVSRFFPGARDVLAAIDDEIVAEVLGPAAAGKALCFEDQYLSTGGQLYEIMAGHDRFIADIRPLLTSVLQSRGLPRPLCCHPYDLCTALVAEELGVRLTDASGAVLDAPFDLDADVSWVAYANDRLRARVEPALLGALSRRGLVPTIDPLDRG